MKKKYMLKAEFLIYAVLLFVMGWLSYRNFGTVTYTYRLENTNIESDYRFFQYVPGNRAEVVIENVEKNPMIAMEKVGNGTAIMIEGYGLGGEVPDQNFTLTYYVDLLSLRSEMPSMEPYWRWIQEYHAGSRMPLNSDRMASGNKTVIDVEEVDAEYQFNYQNLVRALLGVGFGILTLLICSRKRVKWTESGRYAIQYMREKEADWEKEHWEAELRLGREYIDGFVEQQGKTFLIFIVFLLTTSVVFLPMGLETYMVYFPMAACLIIDVIWCAVNMAKNYKNLSSLLTEECRPQAAVTAFTSSYGSRQWIGMRLRHNYAYQSMISLGFYYGGEFHQALEHLELVWEELPVYMKRSVYQIHYHMTRLECFQELGNEEEASEERRLIEDYLRKHPKSESGIYAKRYRRRERIASLVEAGAYQDAERLLKEDAAPENPRYFQAGAHYNMWCIARLKNDDDQMGTHKEFIYQYGKNLFFYSKIKNLTLSGSN